MNWEIAVIAVQKRRDQTSKAAVLYADQFKLLGYRSLF